MMLLLIIYVVMENISQAVKIGTMIGDLMIIVRTILKDHHQVQINICTCTCIYNLELYFIC